MLSIYVRVCGHTVFGRLVNGQVQMLNKSKTCSVVLVSVQKRSAQCTDGVE